MRKKISLSVAFALALVSSLILGPQVAFGYPSSYSGSWRFVSNNYDQCDWSVSDRIDPSTVYPTRYRLKVVNQIQCNTSIYKLNTGEDAAWDSYPDGGAFANKYVNFYATDLSNTATGGNSIAGTCSYHSSYCRRVETWDFIPVNATVTVNQVGEARLGRDSNVGDYWIEAPCGDSVGNGYGYCESPVTLTAGP